MGFDMLHYARNKDKDQDEYHTVHALQATSLLLLALCYSIEG